MAWPKKVVVALIVGAGVTLLIINLLPGPVAVTVGVVQRGPFVEYIEDEGRTRLRYPYLVSAPIAGYLRRVVLEPGDRVAAGAVLFEIEPAPAPALDPRARGQAREELAAAKARLEAAEADLAARRTELALARNEYARSAPLHERKLISSEELDRRLAQRDAAAAAVRAGEHRVEVARFELESARAIVEIADGRRAPDEEPVLAVRAPIAGVVTRRHRCCEGPLAAGEPVLDLGDLDDLEVQVDLLSMDAVRVRPGMRVILTRWGGDGELEGRVRRVEPGGFEEISALGVEEQRVPVWVEIVAPRETWRPLGDGYRVEARFLLWEGQDVLQVPTSALFRAGERWAVYVVETGRARQREVAVGRRSGLAAQITAGLANGERVVTHPGDRVQDGVRVAIIGEAG